MRLLKRLKYYGQFLRSMIKINFGLLVGMWRLTRLPQPAITFFGGSKLSSKSIHSKRICALAKRLADNGFSIITGGGPGVMEAANLGAFEAANNKKTVKGVEKRETTRRIVSMGIGLSTLEGTNRYLQASIKLSYFFTRKWLLVRYAVGFVVGPGGFGTLDELSEIITLIQTHHMPHTPVVLIGKEYWQPLLDWVEKRALRDKLLTKKDTQIITVTDDVDEAFHIITTKCVGHELCGVSAKSAE